MHRCYKGLSYEKGPLRAVFHKESEELLHLLFLEDNVLAHNRVLLAHFQLFGGVQALRVLAGYIKVTGLLAVSLGGSAHQFNEDAVSAALGHGQYPVFTISTYLTRPHAVGN